MGKKTDQQNEVLNYFFEPLRKLEIPSIAPISYDRLLVHENQPPVLLAGYGPTLLGILAVAVAGATFWIIRGPNPGKIITGYPTSCIVQSVSGVAEIEHVKKGNAKGSIEIARAGMFVEEGLRLTTQTGARVLMRLDKEAALLLDDESRMYVSEMRSERLQSKRNMEFELQNGTVFVEIDKAAIPISLSIRTPQAVYRAAGTRFAVNAVSAVGSRLRVYEGTVAVLPPDNADKGVYVTEGFEVQVIQGQPVTPSTLKLVRFEEKWPRNLMLRNEHAILASSIANDAQTGALSIEHVFEDKLSH